jgi:hypothetical protein
VVLATACGQPAHGSGDPDAQGSGSDGDAMGDAGAGWQTLIQRSWTVNSGLEDFECRHQLVTEDMYVTGFRAISPPGTHHAILTIVPPDQSPPTVVGNYNCNPSAISGTAMGGPEMLYAAGPGTNDFLFPQGVAIKIPAGTYLQLYLHLYNTSDDTQTETSGIMVQTIPAAQVVHEADMMFVGLKGFKILADGLPYSKGTDCGATDNWHILGMWPHMHQIGTHQKIEILHNAVVMKTPLDKAYDFNEQQNYAMDFIVPLGDRIKVTCTWVNNTGTDVYSGEQAANEMCYAGAFMYPKLPDIYACVNIQPNPP